MILKYSTSEAMNEILTRRDRIRRKRERRRTAWYSACVCVVLVMLTLTGLGAGAAVSPSGTGEGQSGLETMGSFLLETRTGGILAALILAFALGILAALIIIRRKQGFQKPDPKNEFPEASKNNENGGSST
jgi:ABC-type Fe3+ transport system permease subunit